MKKEKISFRVLKSQLCRKKFICMPRLRWMEIIDGVRNMDFEGKWCEQVTERIRWIRVVVDSQEFIYLKNWHPGKIVKIDC